jgi:hypothetical protein
MSNYKWIYRYRYTRTDISNLNGHIDLTISVTGPGTDIVNWTDIVKPICPIINGYIGYDFIGNNIDYIDTGSVDQYSHAVMSILIGHIGFGYIGFLKTTQSGFPTTPHLT